MKRFLGKRPAFFKSGQWHFHQDNAPVHNSILVTDYLTKIGIKTVPQPPYSPDIAPLDFCWFPKLRGCRYETIEKMKEAVTKIIDTLTQEDFHGAFQKLLERYNKCIAAGGDYFEGDLSFICELSLKVPLRKKSLETYCIHLVLEVLKYTWGSPCGTIAKVLDCSFEVIKFQQLNHVHFQTDTLMKGMYPLISHRLNSISVVLQQGWPKYKIIHRSWYAIKQRNQT